jgi:hypothetical protein
LNADVSEPSISFPSSEAGYPAFEDGTDRWFRNVGIQKSAAGYTPKRLLTILKNTAKVLNQENIFK